MRSLFYVGSSQKDLAAFPGDARDEVAAALQLALTGGKHPSAKPLKGFTGAGVVEVVADDDGNAYRAVYTLKLDDCIFVLHAFQKKSKKGAATPRRDIELIKTRLKRARELHDQGIHLGSKGYCHEQ